MQLKVVAIEKPDDANLILGQSHFIKTVEDLYEVCVTVAPQMKFGLAFSEASGPCLIRCEGNEEELKRLAVKNLLHLAAGHSFIILLQEAFPLAILNAIKQLPEVCQIFAATANPLQVIVAETEQGRGILGVIDGSSPKGVETDSDIQARQQFLRTIGYKR